MAALHQAALMGNTDIMKLLLDAGAAVDVKDTKGLLFMTPANGANCFAIYYILLMNSNEMPSLSFTLIKRSMHHSLFIHIKICVSGMYILRIAKLDI